MSGRFSLPPLAWNLPCERASMKVLGASEFSWGGAPLLNGGVRGKGASVSRKDSSAIHILHLGLGGDETCRGLVPSGEVPCSATGSGGDGEPPLLGHIPPDSSGRQAELGWQARCHRLLFCPRALVDFLK